MMRPYAALLALLAGCGCATVPSHEALRATTLRLEFTQSICSGTAVGADLVLTAQHCLKGNRLLTVNGQPVTVVGIGRDSRDTLTLRVTGIRFAQWARLGPLPRQGARVRWWGSPLGVPDIYREGYVSGMSGGAMIVDATICKGDSGSGIFDTQGRVVGVVTAMNDASGCTFMIAYPL